MRYYDSLHKLSHLLEGSDAPRKIIVSDAVYSMDGDLADVPNLLQFSIKHETVLLLDDAHGTGCLGACGRGALEWWREQADDTAAFDRMLSDVALVQTGTLSKALGAQGGLSRPRQRLSIISSIRRVFYLLDGFEPGCGRGRTCELENR